MDAATVSRAFKRGGKTIEQRVVQALKTLVRYAEITPAERDLRRQARGLTYQLRCGRISSGFNVPSSSQYRSAQPPLTPCSKSCRAISGPRLAARQ